MSPGPNAGVSYPDPGPGLSPADQYEDADTEATELQCADTLPAPAPESECPATLRDRGLEIGADEVVR